MRLSRASFAPVEVASSDKTSPRIHRLHVEEDGTTVAAGEKARAFMAVEPVDPSRSAKFPQVETQEAGPGEGGVGISPDVARQVTRMMPREKRDSLHYAQVTRCDAGGVEMMTTDGIRAWKVLGAQMRGTFPEWREAVGLAKSQVKIKVAVDGRVLIKALTALLKACPDPGNRNPVFMEFGGSHDPILMRGKNYESNQHVIGFVKPLDTLGQWLEESEWERGIGEAKPAKRLARKVVE